MPPPCQPFGLPFDPPGAPLRGSPGFAGSPSCPCSATEGGQAKRAGAAAPERGWKKIKVVAPIAAARPPAVEMWGRPGSRWAGVGAAGGQPPGCPRGVPAPVHGPRSAGRSRSDLHISTAGGPTRPPLGACSAPQGSRLPFRKSSEYTCLPSGPPEARFLFDATLCDSVRHRATGVRSTRARTATPGGLSR